MENMDFRGGPERGPDKDPRLNSAVFMDQGHPHQLATGEQRGVDPYKLVEVQLSGGAPWGFTLKGGKEHGEPLIITKIEEGSKAAAVDKLLAGDEIVSINDINLSGFRQEAICLVKSSHKFLKLVIKRKNDLACRPHSWHATKFTENRLETAASRLSSTNVCASWPSQYHSSSFDLSNSWSQSNLHRTSGQFSSVGSMEIWDHTPQTYQYGQISSAKSNSSIDHLGNPSKRDSAYGSFSTSSSTPDHTLSSVDALSTENVMYKVGHWETQKQGNSKTVSFLSDNGRFEEKVNSFATPPQYENNLSSRLEDHTNSVYSGPGRSNFVPVWYVPEGKKSPSPPPPPPPLRSDSFAATKSHDGDHAPPLYSDGIQSPQHFEVQNRTPIRTDWSADTAEEQKRMIRSVEKASHRRRGSSPIQRPGFIPNYDLSSPGDRINNNMGHAKRLHSSLSSTDVRFAQSVPESQHHQHQRQYSDEYSFFHNAKASASSKEPKWLSFYSDIRERPFDKHNCHLNQIRIPSNTTTAVSDMGSEENPGLNHYYCVKARQQSAQGTSKSLQFKNERRNSGTGNLAASVSSENPAITMSQNPKYSLPQHLTESSLDICEKRAHCVVNKGEDIKAVVLEDSRKINYSEKSSQNKTFEENLSSHEYKDGQEYFQVSDTKIAQKDFKWNQEKNYHISPQKTPMLHSLAQEEKRQINVAAEIGTNKQTGFDVHLSKNARRSDRFATTLRNEIQMKRAKLQKSKSTAALIEPTKEEDCAENWKHDSQEKTASLSESCYSHMYKDNLKEAQARVLKATSFQRRDLEPNSADYLPDRKINIYNTSPLTLVSEDELGFHELRQSSKEISLSNGAHHLSRIGARKRFTAEQKLKSYSEPEKINEVGILDGNCQTHHRPTTSEEALETFADKWKFFEETSKPVCQTSSQRHASYFHSEAESATPRRNSNEIESGGSWYKKRMRSASLGIENVLCASDRSSETVRYSGHITKSRQPQRLETFAEYQASWKEQRKPIESCSSGKYHSADNILDAGFEQLEKSQYKHERSRSSPSTDFYKQGTSTEAKRQSEKSRKDEELISSVAKSDESSHNLRSSDKEYSEDCLRELTAQEDYSSGNKWKVSGRSIHAGPATVASQQSRGRSGTLPSDYRYSQENVNEKSKDCGALPLVISGLQISDKNQHCLTHIKAKENQQENSILLNKKYDSFPQRPPAAKRDKKHRREDSFSASLVSESLLTVPNRSNQSSPAAHNIAVGSSSPSQVPTKISGKFINAELPETGQLAPTENVFQHLEEKRHLKSEPPLPSAYRYHLKSRMEASRSPSPQFAPPKLTDKPPVAAQDENSTRIERVIDNNTTIKMVPIKIVHSESRSEKASRQNLGTTIDPPTLPSGLEKDQIKTLSTFEQSYSRFCAYTRQGVETELENKSNLSTLQPTESFGRNIKENDISTHAVNYVRAKEKTIEDWKSEELAREIVDKDKSLAEILDPNVKIKTTMDLMEGIFPKDEHLLEEAQHRRKFLLKVSAPKTEEEKKEELTLSLAIPLTTNSTYYSTSAPKAELLIKMKDLQQQQQQQSEEDSENELDHNLSEKKQELIDSISRKLKVLKEARETLLEDIQANNLLGDEVEVVVKDVCKPNEFDKFRMFIGDLDKVVNLLLSLSGRLARVENALNNLDETASPEERRILVEKQKLLIQQHEDAKELKENLDRRERIVFDILASYLSDESLADYEHFVKMKSALIIEQRELEDKIKLGEEQLKCLTESLPPERPK
ncbi:PREDICTED: protein Shroom2 isoform X1 [Thamnophis sirtalis]|uniref:Protein Shroom2 isoform X1 n=1 Tax=Thamnophis sirtalis TaxID=35019 RepID=A0A6I9YC62_9SAUR|nr:PREDICTED: protein Shroom2 isoform X1 [Thamnophis sirtalis]